MKRVLVIGEFGAFGGTKNYLLRLLEYYAARNYEISLAAASETVDERVLAAAERLGIAVINIFEPRQRRCNRWNGFPWRIPYELCIAGVRLRLWRYDLITISVGTPWLYWGLAWFPIRLLYILHTVPPKEWLSRGVRRAARRLVDLRLGTRRRIVAVSRDMYSELSGSWVTGRRHEFVTVVHNTAGPALQAHSRDLGAHFPVVILTLGHLEEYKGPRVWLRVAEQVVGRLGSERVRFVWAGDGSLYRELKEEIGQGAAASIVLAGYVSDVSSLHDESDIYFQPSRVESHGISVLEAMRFGRPSVVSDAGGLPESVVDGRNGFVRRVDDVDGMAEAIVRLVMEPELRYQYGQEAARLYQELFVEDNWCARMDEVHARLVENEA